MSHVQLALDLLRAEHTSALAALEQTAEDLGRARDDLAAMTEEATDSDAQAVSLSRALARRIRRDARTAASRRRLVRRAPTPLDLDVELVRDCPHFKMAWYLRHNLDVVEAGIDPLVHFVETGGLEGRDPGPSFDSEAYLVRHPEVREQRVNPLVHHLRNGGS